MAGDEDVQDRGHRVYAGGVEDGRVDRRTGWDDAEGLFDRFADLTRIGIDEISYKPEYTDGVGNYVS